MKCKKPMGLWYSKGDRCRTKWHTEHVKMLAFYCNIKSNGESLEGLKREHDIDFCFITIPLASMRGRI